MEYIYFNSRDELLRLRITEIAYFESDGNYCNVVTANKLRYICKVNIPKQRLVITDYDRFTFQLPISRDALKQLKALITLSTEKK